jgi:hypothetical protein
MRFRDDNPADLARARADVAAWRVQNPAGNAEELIAAIGCQFHHDWSPVLRAILHVIDKHQARVACGIVTEATGAPR